MIPVSNPESETDRRGEEVRTEWYCAGCGETYDERPGVSCDECPYNALIEREVDDAV